MLVHWRKVKGGSPNIDPAGRKDRGSEMTVFFLRGFFWRDFTGWEQSVATPFLGRRLVAGAEHGGTRWTLLQDTNTPINRAKKVLNKQHSAELVMTLDLSHIVTMLHPQTRIVPCILLERSQLYFSVCETINRDESILEIISN